MNRNERLVGGSFQKSGIEAEETRGSGSVNDDADLRVKDFLVECKERTTNSNITIPYKFVKKVRQQALNRDKEWMVVYTNSMGEKFALLDLDTLVYYLREEDGDGEEEKGRGRPTQGG